MCTCALAGPADPSRLQYTQPDGSTVYYYMHGDEHLHWMTDENGNAIEIGEDGYVHPAQMPAEDEFSRAAKIRSAQSLRRIGRSTSLTGEHKFCVVLVQFNDVKFTKTKTHFNNFFNGTGAGSTASVNQYWTDQSDGKFIPSFDIHGPYTMDKNLSYYYSDGWSAKSILINAIKYHQTEDDQIDFTQYTGNGSSGVESVIMIFAGYSAASGAQSIWPCQGDDLASYSEDGVTLNSFCCGAELQGSSGSTIAGIGHICHELGHCFGMPDFYDTERTSDQNHIAADPCYTFSLMDHGSYKDNSKTPPPLSMVEKYLCGWVSNLTTDGIQTVSSSSDISLAEIGQGSGTRAIRINTDTRNEFFICEFRSSNTSINKWSKGLPKGGMVVFHVDRTSSWGVAPNNDWQHPMYYLVNASDQDYIQLYSDRSSTPWSSFPFPGNANINSYNPVSWSGTDTYVSLTGMPNIGASSTNTSISVKAHVRSFPLINNPCKGIYSAGSRFALKLSPGSQGSETVSSWYFDGTETTDDSVTLSTGSHTVEAVLASGKRLRLEITVK